MLRSKNTNDCQVRTLKPQKDWSDQVNKSQCNRTRTTPGGTDQTDPEASGTRINIKYIDQNTADELLRPEDAKKNLCVRKRKMSRRKYSNA
jgi:hypothetical protein